MIQECFVELSMTMEGEAVALDVTLAHTDVRLSLTKPRCSFGKERFDFVQYGTNLEQWLARHSVIVKDPIGCGRASHEQQWSGAGRSP
jgi:hypothetical protein